MDLFNETLVTSGDGESPRYVISLDGIDLNTLTQFRYRSGDRTVPLWSPSSDLGTEYYEFEVLAEEQGESDDESLGNAPSEKCHICDIDVPSFYWREHMGSATHRACKSIADICLHRAQKTVLKSPALPSRLPRSPLAYFCPPCARTVATSKTQTHQLSEEHSKSAQYVKLLESLAKLFESKDNFDSVCKDVFDCVIKERKGIMDYKYNIVNVNGEDFDRVNNEGEEDRNDAAATSIDGKDQLQLTNTGATKDAEGQNRAYAIIYPKSGAKLRIPLDNYHGFHTVENKTLCRVCRVPVEDKFEHEWAMEHRERVEATVTDKHCIRQLDHTLNHCMLCNDIFESMEQHILCGSKHNFLLENALLVDDKTPKTEDSYTKEVMAENFIENIAFNKENYYCKLCQIYIIKSALFEHVKKEAHKNNFATLNLKKKKIIKGDKMSGYCTACQLNIEEGKKAEKRHRRSKDHKYNEWLSEKDSRLHYLMKKSGYPNEVVCKVCCVQISGKVHAINKHIESNDHRTNYKKVLDENFMEETSDIRVYCTLCKVTEYMIDVLDHIKTKCHNKRIINCRSMRIGNVELKQLRSENTAAKSPRDNTKVTEVLENNRICEYNESYYQCKVCLQCFKKPNIFDHVISKKHERRLIEFVSENTAVKSKQEAASLQTQNVNERAEKIQTNYLNILTGNDTTHTEPTNRGVFETKDNGLVTKLEGNGIEIKQGIHYCGVCDLAILNGFEETHIESETHLNNLAKAQRFSANGLSKTGSTYCCSLCLEAFQSDFVEAHLESQIHRTNFDKHETLSANGVLKTGLNFFCNICLVSLQRGSAIEHIKSVNHIRDFQSKSGANLKPSAINLNNTSIEEIGTNPVKTREIYQPSIRTQKSPKKLHYLFDVTDFDNVVTCLVCKIKMTFDQVMSHRKSNAHKEVYQNLMDANTMFRIKHRCFCECCREIMKVNEEYIHLTSDGHVFNLTHTTERMNKNDLKELSVKLFSEDIAAEKKARRQERSARFDLAEEDSDDCGENRFENLKALLFLNSPVKQQKDKDDKDKSFSGSNDSFVSAVSDISVGERQDLKLEVEYLNKQEDSNEPQEYEIKAEFVKTRQDLKVEIEDLHKKEDSNEPQEYEIKAELVKTSQGLKVEIEDLHKKEDSNNPQEHETEAEFVKTIAHLFEESDNSKQVLCKLCHSAVGNRSDLIREHVIGVKHTKNYECILLSNNLKEIVDNFSETIEKYRCKACGIDVGTSELFIHINSDKHRFYLTVQPSSSGYSEPSKDPKSDLESEQQKEGQSINVSVKKHDTALAKSKDDEKSSLLPQIKKYLMQKDKNNLLFCKICDYDFFYYDLNYHVKSHIHELNYKSFLLENDVRIVGTKFFCDLCKIVLMEEEELEHIYGDKHSANLKYNSFPPSNNQIHKTITNKEMEPNLISKAENKPLSVANDTKIYLCKVCNVKVPNNPNNIKKHNDGNKHKSNIKPNPKIQTKAVQNVKSQILLKAILVPGTTASESQTQSKVAPNVPPETRNAKFKLQAKEVASTPNTIKYNMRNTPEPAIRNYVENGLCLVCNTKVPNNEFSIREHLKGTAHNKNLETLKLKTTKNNKGHLPVQNHHKNQPGVAGTSQNNARLQEAKAKLNNSHLSAAGASFNSYENYIDPFVVKGYCHLCKINVPNNISNIKGHINGNTHKTQLSKSIANKRDKPSRIVSQNQTAAAGISQSIAGIQMTKAKVKNPELTSARIDINLPENNINTYIKRGYCHLCKIRVPDNDRNKKEHLNGNSHIIQLQLLKSNLNKKDNPLGNVKQTDDKQQSIPGVSGTNTVRDVNIKNSDSSAPNVTENKTAGFVEEGYCNLCQMKVPDNISNIREHINGWFHNQRLQSLKSNVSNNTPTRNTQQLDNNYQNFSKDSGICKVKNDNNQICVVDTTSNVTDDINSYMKTGYCKFCEKEVTSNISNVKVHISGKTHKENLQKIEKPKNATELSAKLSECESLYECAVCNFKVANTPNVIANHFEGAMHKSNFETLSRRDKILFYTSEMVAKLISTKNENSKVCPSREVKYFCSICNIKVNTLNVMEHMNKKFHIENLKCLQLEHSAEMAAIGAKIFKNKFTYICSVCKIEAIHTSDAVANHFQDPMHINNIDKLSKRDQLLFYTTELLDELKRRKEINNINLKISLQVDYECHFCNVKVSNNTNCIKQHIEGARHKKNVEQLKSKQIYISGVAQSSSNDNITNLEKNNVNTSSTSVENDVRKEITTEEIAANATISNSRLLSTEIVNERTDYTEINNDAKNVMEIDKKNNVDTSKDSANVTECGDSVTNGVDDIKLDITKNKSIQVVELGDSDTNECGDDNNNDKIATLAECNKTLDVAGTTVNAETSNSNFTSENNTDAANDIKNNMTTVASPSNDENMSISNTNQTDLTNTDTNRDDSNIKVVVTSPVDGKSKADDSETDTDSSCEGIYTCSVCNQSMPDNTTEIQNHLKSFHHGNRLKEKKESLQNTDAHFCDICKVEVPKNPISIKKHSDSEMHKKKFDVIVSDNQIKIRDDKVCFCEACDVYFSKASVSSHINRAKHKFLISK